MLNLLAELNPEQRRAAETTEGPVLILAGAGTGKTRAITFRMANLIANGVPAEAILAVTFTNKAAQEMRNRVSDLSPPRRGSSLRNHGSLRSIPSAPACYAAKRSARLPCDFAVYDDDDQIAAIKLAMSKLAIDDDTLTPRNVLSRISYAKNHAQTPENLRGAATTKTAATSPACTPNTNACSIKAKR